jgi:L-threonylcarbamoyladenylate synthase
MTLFETRILPMGQGDEDAGAVAAAVAELRAGRPVAVPTETVYGLAGDPSRGEAVTAIYEAKGRPLFNPLIIHVADMAMARRIGVFDAEAETLAEMFWPGPLTLVLPLADGAPVHPLALAGLATVALRLPAGPMRRVIEAFGGPLAAPSANASGRLSPTSAGAVHDSLQGLIPLILDGGACAVGVESTIIGRDGNGWRLLRPGGLDGGAIEAVLGRRLHRAQAGAAIVAPGMLASHYAPRANLRLGARDVGEGEALLGFGPVRAAGTPAAFLNLSEAGDTSEAARNLFGHLRALDALAPRSIAVEPVPSTGLGEAVNDRLARAAAPRDA